MPGIKRRKYQSTQAELVRGAVKKVRAALYVRVSTEEQATEGFSLGGQEEKLRGYCVSREWTVQDVYREEGASGREIGATKRPQYDRMMKAADKWDLILVLKMDRIHRNSRNFIAMMDELARREKGFASVQDNLDTKSAMGRFVMDIIQRIAQLESEQIGERTSFGMIHKIRSAATGGGVALGQRRPFGYLWRSPSGELEDYAHDGAQLVPHPKESGIVKRIFNLAAKGGSVQKISESLGWCKCKPKEEKRRYALQDGTIKIWTGTTIRGDCSGCQRVRYVLGNPTYLGYVLFAEQIFPGEHEALVDRKTFEAYNRRRAVPVVLPAAKGR